MKINNPYEEKGEKKSKIEFVNQNYIKCITPHLIIKMIKETQNLSHSRDGSESWTTTRTLLKGYVCDLKMKDKTEYKEVEILGGCELVEMNYKKRDRSISENFTDDGWGMEKEEVDTFIPYPTEIRNIILDDFIKFIDRYRGKGTNYINPDLFT